MRTFMLIFNKPFLLCELILYHKEILLDKHEQLSHNHEDAYDGAAQLSHRTVCGKRKEHSQTKTGMQQTNKVICV